MSRFFVLSLCVLATCSAFDVTIKMDDDGFHPANLTLTNVKPGDAIIWVWKFDAFRNLDLKQAATYEDWLACNATGTEFGTSEYKYDTYNFTFNATNDYPRNIYFFTDKLCQKIGMRGMIVVERTDVTTGIQTTDVQTTEVKTTGIQTTGVQTTGIHTTGVIVTTGIQTTGVQTTGVQTTEVQTTGVQTTGVQTTEVHTTGVQTTDVQTTDVKTTGIPTTTVSNVTTGIQTTGIQTTGVQTTAVIQTTGVQTTAFNNMTTGIQTTGVQTTGIQTTGAVPANATTTGDSSVISVCKMVVAVCVVIAAML